MGTQHPRVDDYIERAAPFAQPILAHIRGLWHQACPDILEEIKWGAPHFTHKGIVGAMAGFKQHVSMGFWNRKLLSDPEGLFKDTDCTHLSAIKAGSVGELPDDRILLAYMQEAFDLNERGVKRAAGKREALVVPEALADALAESPAARKTYEGFSWSNQKDYVEWVDSAKQAATRHRRVAQAIEWMEEGKPRNWKYMKKYRT